MSADPTTPPESPLASAERLEELRRLSEAASDGPWMLEPDERGLSEVVAADDILVATMWDRNAAFVTEAVNFTRALLAHPALAAALLRGLGAGVEERPEPDENGVVRVGQRTGYDCIRASLASITGLNVPDFTSPFIGEKDIRPFGDSQTWLRSRGWDLLDDTGERPMPGYSLAVGRSPTVPNANHATVALDGVVVWDPSPHRDDPSRVFEPSGYWPVRRLSARPGPTDGPSQRGEGCAKPGCGLEDAHPFHSPGHSTHFHVYQRPAPAAQEDRS